MCEEEVKLGNLSTAMFGFSRNHLAEGHESQKLINTQTDRFHTPDVAVPCTALCVSSPRLADAFFDVLVETPVSRYIAREASRG